MNTLKTIRVWDPRVAMLGLAIGLGMGAVLAPKAQADQQLSMMTLGYQSGMITAVYQTYFEIDRRMYSLTPDAVIVDNKGHQLDASSIRVDAEVKFRLKKDESDKIDKMILLLPR